jgi:hypothetical protein
MVIMTRAEHHMNQSLTKGRTWRGRLTGRPTFRWGRVSLLALLVFAFGEPSSVRAIAVEDGVALAIVYDTSGSMRDPVPNRDGGSSPKFVIANRALKAVADQIEKSATNSSAGSPRKIATGLFIFQGEHARAAIPMAPFDGNALRDWASRFSTPAGNTPLGAALGVAGHAVLESPLARKHILIITDGMNTAGPPPAKVLPRLKDQAAQQGSNISVHFVAFDVDAKVFDSVKRQGATVVAAADEQQLNSQLQFILQRKILLEEEEPSQKK